MEVQIPSRLRASARAADWMAVLRWTLAAAFIVPGLAKLALGDGIHRGGAEMPVFDALHSVGAYWRFLGLGQVIGGLLLLAPRTAALGALVCLPIVANIVVLVFALPFHAADRAAIALLLAGHLAVVAWEWPRLAPVMGASAAHGSLRGAVARAWRHRRVRLAAAAAAVLWLGMHVADRLNDS